MVKTSRAEVAFGFRRKLKFDAAYIDRTADRAYIGTAAVLDCVPAVLRP
jgi:hypothetical protein